MATILVVDDDPLIASFLRRALIHDGHNPVVLDRGEEVLAAVKEHAPALVILDISLPGIGGVELCRRLRQESSIPVLFLSAYSDEAQKVLALDAGGDDYVTKPVGVAELSARVRAQLRRATAQPASDGVLEAGDIRLDVHAHRVTIKGDEVRLTPKEFDLLRLLMEARSRTLKRQELLDQVWGTEWFGDDNVLDVFIRQLRGKVEADPKRPEYIQTVRRVGYRFGA